MSGPLAFVPVPRKSEFGLLKEKDRKTGEIRGQKENLRWPVESREESNSPCRESWGNIRGLFMRLDSQRLGWVLALLAALGVGAETLGAQGGSTTPKPPAPKPAPPKAQPAPAPRPPAARPVAPLPVVVRPAAPRPVYRQPPRNNNNQPRPTDTTTTTNYVVTFADKGKVRMMEEPLEFDEKGTRKKFTAEELKQFKGDTPADQKLPGYTAVYSDIQLGDNVKVSLSTFKPNPKKKDTDKKDSDKADAGKKDADKKDTADEKKADEKKADADKKDGDDKKAEKDGDKETTKKDADEKKAEKKDKDAPAEEAEDGRWVPAGVLEGTVTKLDKATGSSSLRFTVRVTTKRTDMLRPNQPRPANKPGTPQEINPDQKQATMIVVAKRPEGGIDMAKTK